MNKMSEFFRGIENLKALLSDLEGDEHDGIKSLRVSLAEVLIESYKADLWVSLEKKCFSSEERGYVEDIIQDCFFVVARGVHGITGTTEAAAKGWLFSVANREFTRRMPGYVGPDLPLPEIEIEGASEEVSDLENKEEKEEREKLLRMSRDYVSCRSGLLNQKEKRVTQLKYFEKFTHKEIGLRFLLIFTLTEEEEKEAIKIDLDKGKLPDLLREKIFLHHNHRLSEEIQIIQKRRHWQIVDQKIKQRKKRYTVMEEDGAVKVYFSITEGDSKATLFRALEKIKKIL